jgi:predicted DNA-binding protein (MmcQ/YjbR family)
MTIDGFNRFCAALPATTHVVQWGGADVWKVGGKVFVIGRLEGDVPAFSFKVSPLAFELMRDQPGLRPAPYLASRGLKWIQHFAAPGLSSTELTRYLAESHRIVGRGLSQKTRLELGLLAEPASVDRAAAVTCDNPTC